MPLQVAHIHWNYKAADDIVKVEVWDVVDKGRPKKKSGGGGNSPEGGGGGGGGLKIHANQPAAAAAAVAAATADLALDAELIDVYKVCKGAITLKICLPKFNYHRWRHLHRCRHLVYFSETVRSV